MKKIILSALLASTVAMTAFAAPATDGGLFEGVGVTAALGVTSMFEVEDVSDFGATLTEAGATSVEGLGAPRKGVQAIKAQVPGPSGTSIFCVTSSDNSHGKGKRAAVVCAAHLQGAVDLLQAISSKAGE